MATTTTLAAEEIFHIPLADIQLSKTNPRQERDTQALDDLANDIKKRGVQEPILVRPITSPDAKFELVFGERRYLASQKAGAPTIRAMKRELSEEEAEDLQIMENLQREDLSFLDEAAAFKRLYDRRFNEAQRHDDAVAFVVATVNKRPEYVIQRLKLNDLIPTAKSAVRQGKLLLGHASELARLRTEEQETALKWLLRQSKDVRTADGWKKAHVIPGVPEFRLWIQQNLFLGLKTAPFDTADPNLNPSMGACTDCQFRSGNQPALFGDIKKGDICTAAPCWLAKRSATVVNMAAATAKELGVKSVLKVGIGHASWNDPKVPVDAYIEYGSEARIVKPGTECQHTKPGVITWIAHPGDAGSQKVGDTVLVCVQANDCPVHKKVDSRAERPKKSFEEMADTRIANLRKELPQRIRAALIRGVIETALKRAQSLSAADRTKFDLAASQMHADLYFDRHRDLCKLMEVEPADRDGQGRDWRGATRKMFSGHPVAMMVAMLLMHRYHISHDVGGDADSLKPLLRVYKVDAKRIERQLRDDTTAKISAIQATLKKRKTKQTGRSDPNSAKRTTEKG
jgi:ParB family transcriptional regulator, chromosome partitioning protein